MKQILKVVILIASAAVIGCGGGSMSINAAHLDKPVSTTSGVFSNDGILLGASGYTSDPAFELDLSRWHILWAIVPLSANPDISDTLNSIIRERQGDGIVNLSVKTGVNNPLFWLGSIVPIIPTSVGASITGQVYHLKK